MTILNTNPVVLDSRGEASIWGTGDYRQVVRDADGNLIWDRVTSDVSAAVDAVEQELQDYILNHGFQVVNSVAAVQALDVSKYHNAYATGYYEDHPGIGGGTYVYDPDSAATPNGGTVLPAAGGTGRWILQTTFARASQFGVVGDGTDETNRVQAFFDYLVQAKRGHLDVTATVSHVEIADANGLYLESSGSLTGLTTGSYESVLSLINPVDVTINGRLPVSAAYNAGYECAVAVYTDNGTQAAKLNLQNVVPVGAMLAWKIGRPSETNALISEIIIGMGAYSFGTTSFLEAYGTQTVVNVVAGQNISDLGSNPPGWVNNNRIGIRAVGAQVNVLGGELLLADVTTGIGVSIEPINDPVNGALYGTVKLNGVEVEVASQLCVFRNPSGVGNVVAGRGGFFMTGCAGVHTQNITPWIESTDGTFTGEIRIDKSNKFFCTTSRTVATIACAGNVNVYVDDGVFGTGFVQGLSGIVGGIVHFGKRRIIEVRNTNNQVFPNSTQTTVKWTQYISTIDTARFVACYDATTGKIKVPAGGLKDIEICAMVFFASFTANTVPVDIYVNGQQRARFVTTNYQWYGGGFMPIGDLVEGDEIEVRLTQTSGNSATETGGALTKIVVNAWN